MPSKQTNAKLGTPAARGTPPPEDDEPGDAEVSLEQLAAVLHNIAHPSAAATSRTEKATDCRYKDYDSNPAITRIFGAIHSTVQITPPRKTGITSGVPPKRERKRGPVHTIARRAGDVDNWLLRSAGQSLHLRGI